MPSSWVTPEGERREDSEWFNVVAWGSLAEICKQHLMKGQQVYIEGRLQTRGWEDTEGKRHYRTEIVANEMVLLGDRRSHAPHEEFSQFDEVEHDEGFPF